MPISEIKKSEVDNFMDSRVKKFYRDTIEMTFNPEWYYVSSIWLFTNDILLQLIKDRTKAELISMSISELLENSVKYSQKQFKDPYPVVKIKLTVRKDKKKIFLEVENYADPDHIEILKQELKTIQSSGSREVFIKKLREAAIRDDGKSQLGLIRIIYEAKGTVTMTQDGLTVRMKVEFDI
jgi:anti-sigma regulatory factor (Ser/Thr protein kinase)